MDGKCSYRLGIDIGSTTMKMVITDAESGRVILDSYRRHQTQIRRCLDGFLDIIGEKFPEAESISVCMTGSIGIGMAEHLSLPFIQEVVAATDFVKKYHPETEALIDIGGEDAKMVFFSGGSPDLRMNGNCAGGTGAFIDQMAVLMNVSASEFGRMAESSTQLYPIASRCGVFCKTDVQNLIARNVPGEDIAASIFHAVAVQTITTLAHGHKICAPILLCGGPLTFIPALRKAFSDYLGIAPEQFILPEKANLIPAWGAAVSGYGKEIRIEELRRRLHDDTASATHEGSSALSPLFGSREEYDSWKERMGGGDIGHAEWKEGPVKAFIGIDSGSTTTKITVLDVNGKMLFSYYRDNNGNPVGTVKEGLEELAGMCRQHGTELQIEGSCSTGYGEDLIKAAFHLDSGIVETMAHYMAARNIREDVSFILDIGGQDMKAIFIENGVINRIEVNEACSSGCGSFISTFARSLGYSVGDFAQAACLAPAPCDLGTRCTVFMNSKVKQVLCEGASMEDIAAGLSYSVIKNCLYKVLRLKDTSVLGDCFVVQGGTMRNDSVVRALEILTGKQVFRSSCPELMGAYGCALYAMRHAGSRPAHLEDMLSGAEYTSDLLHCRGCENRCTVTRYRFGNDSLFYSGNRCEKVFNNRGKQTTPGLNAYEHKRKLLFDREMTLPNPLLTIGIPRCLNMYEEYPFWHTLLAACNIQVKLSDVSAYRHYEQCAGLVMSDNICFPAKLAHSHIDDLVNKSVDRIFMPFVLYELPDRQMQNSYNCPVVSGYSQVIKSVQSGAVPIDTPTISFKDQDSLYRQCRDYLTPLGVPEATVRAAVKKASAEQEKYADKMISVNGTILSEARSKGALAVMLAGRPYHTDSLIQHKVSEMIAAQGAYVLTDDLVRRKKTEMPDSRYLSQWAFPNRIMKAAVWAAGEGAEVQFMQLTSFGCGPDAFMTDEVRAVLKAAGKNLTLLKIDDVDNIGSLKLRVRSMIESLTVSGTCTGQKKSPASLPPFTAADRKKKIIVPFFTPYISPLIPSLMKLIGYDVDSLPISDSTACGWGLKYSNNEVCYPATLVVGDIVKAFRSGKYDPDNTCVAMTQTGGQCRASNYMSLIRKALVENGYTRTPVISVTFGGGIDNYQPGFKVYWIKILPMALTAVLYSDCIARFFCASAVREKTAGEAERLRDRYLEAAKGPIEQNRAEELFVLLSRAADDFSAICREEEHPRVGIVGEIFLKFHPFAQKHVTEWLMAQGMEIVYPALADFFLQAFVNAKDLKKTHVANRYLPDAAVDLLYRAVRKKVDEVNAIGGRFKYFMPFDDIFEKAEVAGEAVSISAQFGEGWLIAGEVGEMARQGVTHVISLQPFGCIANHIVGKGIENRLKTLYPHINMLSLDFDSSVSEVNITNRLLLFINDLKEVNNLQHNQ